jgi:DNA-binding MarR family transcriptional regulator
LARPSKPEQLQIQQRCYELWAQGKSHTDIARLAEVAPNTVTKYVKRFLAAQPIASLSREEREAAIFAEWAEIGQRMRADMEEQRHRGRIKVVRTRHPDGSETVEQSMITGVDPQLYRAWGAHLDRKARQLLDQTPVSEGGNVVNVSVVRDFLGQGDAPAARLSAEQWNEQAIDV